MIGLAGVNAVGHRSLVGSSSPSPPSLKLFHISMMVIACVIVMIVVVAACCSRCGVLLIYICIIYERDLFVSLHSHVLFDSACLILCTREEADLFPPLYSGGNK